METARMGCIDLLIKYLLLYKSVRKLSVSTVGEHRNSKTDLKLTFLKTFSGQSCVSYRAARLWNY